MNIYIEDNLGAGVYMIQNLTNGKMYIGQSTNITKRLANHANQLHSGKHIIRELQSDYNSGNQFTYKVLFKVDTDSRDYMRKLLITMEHEHLMLHDRTLLYNQDFTEPYIWNTIIQIPDAFRFDDRYHKGDIYRPEFQKWITHKDQSTSHSLEKMLSDVQA